MCGMLGMAIAICSSIRYNIPASFSFYSTWRTRASVRARLCAAPTWRCACVCVCVDVPRRLLQLWSLDVARSAFRLPNNWNCGTNDTRNSNRTAQQWNTLLFVFFFLWNFIKIVELHFFFFRNRPEENQTQFRGLNSIFGNQFRFRGFKCKWRKSVSNRKRNGKIIPNWRKEMKEVGFRAFVFVLISSRWDFERPK